MPLSLSTRSLIASLRIWCGNLIVLAAIDYVYFYEIEFAKYILPYRNLVVSVQDVLQALWPIDNTWDSKVGNSIYRDGRLEIHRSYG